MSRGRDVLGPGRDRHSRRSYRVRMHDTEVGPGHRFATLIKDARDQRGWTQEDLVNASGVSRQTIIRYESGKATNPQPAEVRAVCSALELDPREAVIALGYVTRAELELPPPEPRMDPLLARAARTLADARVPASAKDLLRSGIKHALEAWDDFRAEFDQIRAQAEPGQPRKRQNKKSTT